MRNLLIAGGTGKVGSHLVQRLSERPAAELRASGERVCCFESTTAGLIQAALIASPGASELTTCGAVSYTTSRCAFR